MTQDLLASLNPSQRQAAQHHCGPLLVVAGAGSGKTRALSYRIAHLVLQHEVDPGDILAVTFTNKAAREMKLRIERLFAEQSCLSEYGIPLAELEPHKQTRLRSQVYRKLIKPLSIGTFHSLFSRLLRLEIEKYQDPKGRQWNHNFSIFDESDVQGLIKEIITQTLKLDDRRYEPRAVRYAISNAKNQGWTPEELERQQPNVRGRTIAQVYAHYLDQLAANNGLDFDDLIWIPVQLFRQNPDVLAYWHHRYRHILVDEYQDTNRTQYELIQMLSTNGETRKERLNWEQRSIFVVGDSDQSIYKFRGADFTILMEFQESFGDGLADIKTQTMVKLEENYRSTQAILGLANHLIEHNSERIEKTLRATREQGDPAVCFKADNEQFEADFVVTRIRQMYGSLDQQLEGSGGNWGDYAILYRTNAQSRPLEEALMRAGIPYLIVGGLRFYDRREIKDVLGYLRAVMNPADTLSLLRVINTPRRGVGKTTIDKLTATAATLGVPLWEILSDPTSVKTVAGRSAQPVINFAKLIQHWHQQVQSVTAGEVIKGILDESGYWDDLKAQSTDEAEDRAQNVMELLNAARQFEEEEGDPSLESFLSNASLASDLDNLDDNGGRVSLMTLHSSKGLEFPTVFLVGLEQGLFPNHRSIDDPVSLEEERRLCYVGITRAQQNLFLTYAQERRLYGSREPAFPSMFLEELPREWLHMEGGALPIGRSVKRSRPAEVRAAAPSSKGTPATTTKPRGIRADQSWTVGERIEHSQFGFGQITHVFGSGQKVTLAVKFPGLGQQKILDPRLAPIEKV
jgi:DNA helicase-2/ATP-dependent DNA helicase PcrA